MKDFRKFSDVFNQMIEERRARNIDNIAKYWIWLLDSVLWWIIENELVIIWAWSWIWKTELAVQIAINNARNWKKVALYSLEWDICEIAYRYAQTQINTMLKQAWKWFVSWPDFRLNIQDVEYYEDIVKGRLPKELDNIFIYDRICIPTPQKLIESINDSYEYVDMFVIDHLHYLDVGEDEYQWISGVVKKIKETTEAMKKPVVLVSHLSRNFVREKRDPTPSDLHWSSNIEKNANTVILLTRWNEEFSDKTMASTKIIIWKNRSWLKCPTVLNACFNIWTKEYMKWNDFNSIDIWF